MVIEWGDAFIETDDFSIEEAQDTKPVYRRTVGFLVAHNQHGYVLATDKYEDEADGVAGRMFIPKGMVVSVTQLTNNVTRVTKGVEVCGQA